MSAVFDHLQERIGYRFRDITLLEAALTHASVQKKKVNNERLEFLGDRVLGLAVAEMLYRSFPQEREGALAKRLTGLVQQSALAQVAEKISLAEHVKMSSGEKKAGGLKKDTILSDAVEALVAAIYLDGGLAAAFSFVDRFWSNMQAVETGPPEDPKTLLQEWAQARALPLPEYAVTSREGNAHEPLFTVKVTLKDRGSAAASGRTKRAAEKEAALRLLEKIGALS